GLGADDGILVIGFNDEELYSKVTRPIAKLNMSPSTTPDDDASDVGYFDSLVIGAGHAAQKMHIPCIKAATRDSEHLVSGRIVLVERNASIVTPAGLPCFRSIADADLDPAYTVVHDTTGPADRPKVVKDAARLGYRNFILEKPL